MATYPGLNLSGEIRESISLDEDDLSDVEDEVFIRDGKTRFKYSEDIGLKRPLMAPRRKLTKPDFKSRLRNRPPCRPYCKPCCYICGGLLVLIGLIILVVIIVSMFPLPIDKMKDWIVTKAQTNTTNSQLVLPCSELKVTNVWSVTIPKLTSETSIRAVDINLDGVDDIIFGFGTGNRGSLSEEIFCPMFMNVASPCGGGLMALNGLNGEQLWRKHLPYVVFIIFCSYDLNADGINDCIVTGNRGMLLTVSGKDGATIWTFTNDDPNDLKMNIYAGNFVPDQDNDTVADILVSHTAQKDNDRVGSLIIISGKTGTEIKRIPTPYNVETYYIPQLLPQRDGQYLILLGTGSPSTSGNLTTISLTNLINANGSFNTIFEYKLSGIISPSILVDITGDGQLDIVSALFNTTIIAIDGLTFQPIWKVVVNNSETLSIPTPGFFNDDNVTDFLVKYQTGAGFPVYYFSQSFVIDGKTGEVINSSRVIDSVGSQMGGLSLTSEKRGSDFFLYWTADCKGFEGRKDKFSFLPESTLTEQNYADMCNLRFNSTKVTKLYALNQYEQPPGIEIYTSDSKIDIEYNNTHSSLEEAIEYIRNNPEVQVQTPQESHRPVGNKLNASYRHKYDDAGLLKPVSMGGKYADYDANGDTWQKDINYGVGAVPDIDAAYPYEEETPRLFSELANRNTRGDTIEQDGILMKQEPDNNGIYGYKNIKQSRNKLLHDLNSSPTEILKDTYFKNLEHQLRKSRFEQRDLKAHHDKLKENEEIAKFIDAEKKKALNVSINLWDLETEKEMEDRKYGYARGKRQSNVTQTGIPLLSSIGTLLPPFNATLNAIDLIFLTYWTPSMVGPVILLEKDLECITKKIMNLKNSKEEMNTDQIVLKNRYTKECLFDRGAYQTFSSNQQAKSHTQQNPEIPYFKEISQVSLGQMTVYRIRIECTRCSIQNKGERCAKFLNPKISTNNVWSAYLNWHGDGIFNAL